MREDSETAAETRLNRLLNLILETAVDVLGVDAATVTTRVPGGYSTIAATDQRLVALDDAQYDSGEGPCLSVLDAGDPIYIDDAGIDDPQWRYFSRTAHHLGVHSTLSIHIPTETSEVAASLNFFAQRRLGLGADEIRRAESFAQQLAAAILSVKAYRSTAKLADDMVVAMASRSVIEQAKGMLMAEQTIPADQAFTVMVNLSQQRNIRLRILAEEIVLARSTPQ
jgi:GAF domain-containing protein